MAIKQIDEGKQFWRLLEKILVGNGVHVLKVDEIYLGLDEDSLFSIKNDITQLVVNDLQDKGVL